MKELRDFLIKIITEAGDYAQSHFGLLEKEDIAYKYEYNKGIVTSVDIYLDAFLRKQILEKYPDNDIISEENESINNAGDVVWIIDPIDGTINFSNTNPNYCISIGVAMKGVIILGAIYAPALNQLFLAQRGEGVWLNGKKIKQEEIEHYYADDKRLSRHDLKSYFKDHPQIHLGSAALELAYVALGKSAGSILENIMIWDIAAGILMVEEMGGKLLNFEGKTYTLSDANLMAIR